MINELIGFDDTFPFMPYSKRVKTWTVLFTDHLCRRSLVNILVSYFQRTQLLGRKSHLRLFHQTFNDTAVKAFNPQLMKAARQLLVRLLDRPNGVCQEFRMWAAFWLLYPQLISFKYTDRPYFNHCLWYSCPSRQWSKCCHSRASYASIVHCSETWSLPGCKYALWDFEFYWRFALGPDSLVEIHSVLVPWRRIQA